MKKLFLFISIFSTLALWSQLKFEKGYFIDNQEKKHEVLIKNIDWLENPTSFKYKTEENSEEKTATVDDVKEFQVSGYNKLVRYSGKINISSSDLGNLSFSKEPELIDKTVFLYQISTGEKKLYSYFKKGIQNFFYSDENGDIKLLIFKEFHPNGDDYLVSYNEKYKEQLMSIFSDNLSIKKLVEQTEYSNSSLLRVFNKYNKVSAIENSISTDRVKTKVHLSIKPGINFSKFDYYSPYSSQNNNFNLKSTDFKLSSEMEYVLPFNKNKWSLLLEISYSSINNKSKTINNRDVKINYAYLELPIGARYGFQINKNSKIFASAKFPIFTMKAKKDAGIEYSAYSPYPAYIVYLDKMSSNFIFGIGYSYKNKFFAEVNTSTKRTILDGNNWGNTFTYTNLSLGYNIF